MHGRATAQGAPQGDVERTGFAGFDPADIALGSSKVLAGKEPASPALVLFRPQLCPDPLRVSVLVHAALASQPHPSPKEGAMSTDNFVTVVGNLTDDPELRFTPQGTAVANFRLAVTARVRDGDSWKDGETSFFRVNVWRQLAENAAESLTKGTRAIVVGRLRTRSWETPEGDKRSVTEIEADEVGPSLKWATAKVERASKSRSGASQGDQFNDEPPF